MSKTLGSNLGLGDARPAHRDRKVVPLRIVRMRTFRRGRIREVSKEEWRTARLEYFRNNLRYASAAKAVRTALDVAQWEVAVEYGVSQSSVCTWESGKYGGWTDAELHRYIDQLKSIAARRPRRAAKG